MPISEASRHDLYNGLAELLGSERAETLMTHLPRYDPVDVATKTDIVGLRTDAIDLESRLNSRLDGLGQRLDRLFLTLVAGLFVIVTAMAGVVFTTL